MGHYENRVARSESARHLRRQWEQAIADKRGHDFISVKWEAYVATAGDQLQQIEKEIAHEQKATA